MSYDKIKVVVHYTEPDLGQTVVVDAKTTVMAAVGAAVSHFRDNPAIAGLHLRDENVSICPCPRNMDMSIGQLQRLNNNQSPLILVLPAKGSQPLTDMRRELADLRATQLLSNHTETVQKADSVTGAAAAEESKGIVAMTAAKDDIGSVGIATKKEEEGASLFASVGSITLFAETLAQSNASLVTELNGLRSHVSGLQESHARLQESQARLETQNISLRDEIRSLITEVVAIKETMKAENDKFLNALRKKNATIARILLAED